MLKLVNLEGYEKRAITQLSGGQQQRVAIARALVNEPMVLLLDEPLGALDQKLRKEMQIELKKIQKEVGITFIFVTHDQEEALTMSDKIVVMKDGEIQQIGSPTDIYNEPENEFVLFEYANYHYLMSNFEEAKKYYLKLMHKENVPVFMLISTAVNYMAMNMISKAKKLLIRAIEIEPQNIKALFHLGQIYYFEKNFDNAKQLLEDAYAIAPNTEIANLLAQIYIEVEQYSEAYVLLNLVNLSLPNNFTVQMGLAKCMFKKGDLNTAKKHLNNILEKFPEHEEAQNMMKEIEKVETK